MWQDQKKTSNSPFDCAVCGACVYGSYSSIRTCLPCRSFFRRHAFLPPNALKCNQNGKCSIEETRRYFSASLPPCRACRLQKCLSLGMNQNSMRIRSASSPPSAFIDKLLDNILIETSLLDEHVVSSTKKITNDNNSNRNDDDMKYVRVRCSSDACDHR